jgi:hypothetical protein
MLDSMDLNSLLPKSQSAAAATEEEEESIFPSLTWQERLIGCISCMIIGYIYSFGSLFRIKDLILGNPRESYNIKLTTFTSANNLTSFSYCR